MHKDEEEILEARDDLFPTLTELWRDGKYIEVANIIAHTAPFSNRANLIDFCVYLHKYLGSNDLQILQKLI